MKDKTVTESIEDVESYLAGAWSSVYPEDLRAIIEAARPNAFIADEFARFRGEIRKALFTIGVPASFAWTDADIVQAVQDNLRKPSLKTPPSPPPDATIK